MHREYHGVGKNKEEDQKEDQVVWKVCVWRGLRGSVSKEGVVLRVCQVWKVWGV